LILPESFDVIVLGAGIAGLSVADAALQQGKRCLVIDPKGPGGGASGAPLMLINPATGRRAKKVWQAEKSYSMISSLLQYIQQQTGSHFYEENGVLRPALTEKIADDFKRSITKYGWEQDWLEWISKEDFSRRFPYVGINFGGLLVKKAITLIGSTFLKNYSRILEKNDLYTIYGSHPNLSRYKDRWIVDLGDGAEYEAGIVVDAAGYQQTQRDYWKCIPLHPVKGQLATFYFKEPLGYGHSISSLGYMAVSKIIPKQITVGSTYEHEFEHLNPTPKASAVLHKKLEETLPGLLDKSTGCRQWASVRVSLPDKMPVIGPHPEHRGLYIIGALGSKGMLLGRMAASQLVRQIFQGISPDKELSISRFL
jgi:glycine oxidase